LARKKVLEKIAPKYPLPNSDGDWTPRIIAEYFGRPKQYLRTVTRACNRIMGRGKRGERITLNEKQMQRVVDILRDQSQMGKRGNL
jgi:hypothetical protein